LTDFDDLNGHQKPLKRPFKLEEIKRRKSKWTKNNKNNKEEEGDN